MKLKLAILMLFLPLFAANARGEIYRWTDDSGGVHFTDDFAQIPENYRSRVSLESDSLHINLIPGGELPEPELAETGDEALSEEDLNPPKAEEPAVIWIMRPFLPVKDKQRHKRKASPPVIPKTPARKAQDRIEEKLREDRRSLDGAQLPARQRQNQIEEQIRRTREGISGH